MAGDLLEVVHHDASICKPRERSVPEIVTSQVIEAWFRDDGVPVRCIAQNRRRDPTATRPGEEARILRAIGCRDPAKYEVANLGYQRHLAPALTVGALCRRARRARA